MSNNDKVVPLHTLEPWTVAVQLRNKVVSHAMDLLGLEQHDDIDKRADVVKEWMFDALKFAQTGEGAIDTEQEEWLVRALFDSAACPFNVNADITGDTIEGALVLAVRARNNIASGLAVSINQLASVARLTPRRIRQLVQDGELPETKFGLIPARAALRYLVARKIPGFVTPPEPEKRKKR